MLQPTGDIEEILVDITCEESILGPAGSPGYSQQDNEYFRSIEFSAFDGLGGQTAFMHVVRGDSTTPFSKNPLVVIPKGVNKTIVYQNDHGFNFGMPVYIQNINNVVTYLRAIANSPETSEVVGIVSRIINANSFELTFIGEIYGDFTNVTSSAPGVASPQLVPCVTYYLSPVLPASSAPLAAQLYVRLVELPACQRRTSPTLKFSKNICIILAMLKEHCLELLTLVVHTKIILTHNLYLVKMVI